MLALRDWALICLHSIASRVACPIHEAHAASHVLHATQCTCLFHPLDLPCANASTSSTLVVLRFILWYAPDGWCLFRGCAQEDVAVELAQNKAYLQGVDNMGHPTAIVSSGHLDSRGCGVACVKMRCMCSQAQRALGPH